MELTNIFAINKTNKATTSFVTYYKRL